MAKILLVEDDNNLREIYEARLQAEGYDIVDASDGEEALVVAKAEQPDLVIADVMMPRISGFEMLDILRNTAGLEKVKVIMLTALGQAEDKTRADQLGADRYLVKSQVTLEDIVKAASDLLNSGGAAADNTQPVQAAQEPQPQPQQSVAVPAQVPATAPAPVAPPPTATPAPAPAPTPKPTPPAQSTPQTPAPAAPAPQPVQASQPAPTPNPQPTPAPPATLTTPQQPAAPPSTPQPQAATTQAQPSLPEPPAPTSVNTAELNDAVNNLMNGTNGHQNQSQSQGQATPAPAAPAAPAPKPEPAPPTPQSPEPQQPESDSVTINGKRKIEPLGQGADPRQNINDLLAKEGLDTNPTPQQQHSTPPIGGGAIPTTPHSAGQVFAPVSTPQQQPQNNPPTNPADPNSISL